MLSAIHRCAVDLLTLHDFAAARMLFVSSYLQISTWRRSIEYVIDKILSLDAQKKKRANGARGLSQNKVAGL